ncbi:MAG: class I SAM-dependent methyltransferase [Oscillospiraceae bacterium]|jgi:SAM-dependent methyltransferase|nr:class I SAM-dependent methyltransferase [Oscillospiraceae bacterium]
MRKKETDGLSPGGTALLAEAFGLAGLSKGCSVLDVGCGEADALECIRVGYDARCTGIDQSEAFIGRAREKYPKLTLMKGDADFLEFPSCSFDAVTAECVLSLSKLREEVIHEAYCVLKPGGRYIIADLCDREQLRSLPELEVGAGNGTLDGRTPEAPESGSCGQASDADETQDVVIDVRALANSCTEIGFRIMQIEDRSRELDSFAAEIMLKYGSLESYARSVAPEDGSEASICRAWSYEGKLGYFLMILEKPERVGR